MIFLYVTLCLSSNPTYCLTEKKSKITFESTVACMMGQGTISDPRSGIEFPQGYFIRNLRCGPNEENI